MNVTAAKQQMDQFFATGKTLSFPKRSLIIGYYEKPEYAYWITSGSVKVISCTPEGVERIQHIYDAGELFPIKWLFENQQFDVAFFALTNVTVQVKPIDDFTRFIETTPSALSVIVQQQFGILDRLVNLYIEPAEDRVVFGLVTLAARLNPYERDEQDQSVRLPLSIQDLASIIHLSRETTGKVLRSLERDNQIQLDHQSIRVYPEKLQMLLES